MFYLMALVNMFVFLAFQLLMTISLHLCKSSYNEQTCWPRFTLPSTVPLKATVKQLSKEKPQGNGLPLMQSHQSLDLDNPVLIMITTLY